MQPVSHELPPQLARVTVDSSLMANMEYDDRRATLQVEFRDGSIYQYLDVPIQTYQDLLQAESKGAYFNHHIRGIFTCAMLRRRAMN
jgi:lysyl-tRNA synthetase, class II